MNARVLLIVGGAVLVLGAALLFALWPSADVVTPAGETPVAEVESKTPSLAEQLQQLNRGNAEPVSDGELATVRGVVLDLSDRPVPSVEVVVTVPRSNPLHELTCDVCEQPMWACTDPSKAKELLQLFRSGALAPPSPIATVRTDAKGLFEVVGVPGDAVLSVRTTAFAGAMHLDEVEMADEDTGEFAPDDAPRKLVVHPLKPIRAKVLDEVQREPVKGATVTVIDPSDFSVRTVTSDAQGRVELGGADPDLGLLVMAEARGYIATVTNLFLDGEGEPELGLYPPRVLKVEVTAMGKPVEAEVKVTVNEHPHTVRATNGTARFAELGTNYVRVEASMPGMAPQLTGAELDGPETVLRVDLKRLARTIVTVVDARGQPVEDSRAVLSSTRDSFSPESSDDASATHVFDAGEGRYTLTVRKEGLREATKTVDLKAGENRIEVMMVDAVTISGVVVSDDGSPVAQAVVTVLSQIGDSSTEVTSPDGSFSLAVDEPGPYDLEVRQSRYGRLVTRATAPSQGVKLVLESKARLLVRVSDGRAPVERARIYIERPGGDEMETVITDEQGVARVAGLSSGAATVTVEAEGFVSPDPLKPMLTEGRQLELQVTLDRGVTITGRVVDDTRQPLASAVIFARSAGQHGGTVSATSEPDGRFELTGLKRDTDYLLEGTADSLETLTSTKARAGARDLVLVLSRLPKVRGRVVAAGGASLPSFKVDGRAFSNADGRFEVPATRGEGGFSLFVEATGYLSEVVERETLVEDVGDVVLKAAEQLRGRVVNGRGEAVSAAEVSCDLCSETTSTDGSGGFTLALPSSDEAITFTAENGAQRGKASLAVGQRQLTITLPDNTMVTGKVIDAKGRPVAARITVRELNHGVEQKVDADQEGAFQIDLPEGLYMFITRAAGAGQAVRVSGKQMSVTLGVPPGSCALTLTTAATVSDVWLLPAALDEVNEARLDDDALYAGATALDVPVPNHPSRAAGLTCGVYTLVATDSSGLRRELVDVRRAESTFSLSAPPEAAAAVPSEEDNQPL